MVHCKTITLASLFSRRWPTYQGIRPGNDTDRNWFSSFSTLRLLFFQKVKTRNSWKAKTPENLFGRKSVPRYGNKYPNSSTVHASEVKCTKGWSFSFRPQAEDSPSSLLFCCCGDKEEEKKTCFDRLQSIGILRWPCGKGCRRRRRRRSRGDLAETDTELSNRFSHPNCRSLELLLFFFLEGSELWN